MLPRSKRRRNSVLALSPQRIPACREITNKSRIASANHKFAKEPPLEK